MSASLRAALDAANARVKELTEIAAVYKQRMVNAQNETKEVIAERDAARAEAAVLKESLKAATARVEKAIEDRDRAFRECGMGGFAGDAPERMLLTADETFMGCDAWQHPFRILMGEPVPDRTAWYVRGDIADAALARAEEAENAKRAADLALGLTEECLAAARKRHEAERSSRVYWQNAYDTMWKERDAALARAEKAEAGLRQGHTQCHAEVAGLLTERRALNGMVDAARAEAARWKSDYEDAAGLVARMHAAAVGEVRGPDVGPVEDVAAMAAKAARYRKFVEYVATRKRLPSEHGMDVLKEVQERATRALAGEVKHE